MADKHSKIRVELRPEFNGTDIPSLGQIIEEMWSDDPGQGLSIMLRDARGNPAYEVPSPVSHAPPIGFEPTPPIDELIRDRVRSEFARLRDDEEIDSPEDAEDFDVPDDLPMNSVYEVVQMEETAPRPPNVEMSLAERAKMHVEFMELAERERLNRKRAKEVHLLKQKQAVEAAEAELRLYHSNGPEGSGDPS